MHPRKKKKRQKRKKACSSSNWKGVFISICVKEEISTFNGTLISLYYGIYGSALGGLRVKRNHINIQC